MINKYENKKYEAPKQKTKDDLLESIYRDIRNLTKKVKILEKEYTK